MKTLDTIKFEHFQIKPEHIQVFSYQLWYEKWLSPSIFSNANNMHSIDFLNYFGGLAYAIKLYSNTKNLKKQLKETTYYDLDGHPYKTRRIDKAIFNLSDTALTIASGIGFFILSASWASPFMIATSSVLFLKSVYSTGKNAKALDEFTQSLNSSRSQDSQISIKQMLFGSPFKEVKDYTEYDLMSETKPSIDQINKCKFMRLQVKTQRTAVDVTFSAIAVGLTAIWAIAPIPASIGFTVLGIAWYLKRKKLTEQARAYKQESQKLSTLQRNFPEPRKPSDYRRRRKAIVKPEISADKISRDDKGREPAAAAQIAPSA